MNASSQPSTAAISDACLRLGFSTRVLPAAKVKPILPGVRVSGPAAPVKHFGSVDVILRAIDEYPSGSVLVIDNQAREDEACVGDLLVLEAIQADLQAMVIWGYHRDAEQLLDLGLPMWTLGSHPNGPNRPVESSIIERSVSIADFIVDDTDWVIADSDGVLFMKAGEYEAALEVAAAITATEVLQATKMNVGVSLREQVAFADYLAKQQADPTLTFRQHLRTVGSEIEE